MKNLLWMLILLVALTACSSGEGPTPPVAVSAEAQAVQPDGTPDNSVMIPLVEAAPVSPMVSPVSPVALNAAPIPDALLAKSLELLAPIVGAAVTPADVTVQSVEARQWADAGLGCPQPDMMYAQVLTDGYLMNVVVKGKVYELHSDGGQTVVVCKIDGKDANEGSGQ